MKYDKKFKQYCKKLGKCIQEVREERNITVKELSEKNKYQNCLPLKNI